MTAPQIREDGAGYERMMGTWSAAWSGRYASPIGWRLPPGLRWIDVGCGNGARRSAGATLRTRRSSRASIRPRGGTSSRARRRRGAWRSFRQGDAMALPVSRKQVRCRRHGTGDFLCSQAREQSPRCGWCSRAARSSPTHRNRRRFPQEPIQAGIGAPWSDARPRPSIRIRMEALWDLWAGLEAVERGDRQCATDVRRISRTSGRPPCWDRPPPQRPATMAAGDVERLQCARDTPRRMRGAHHLRGPRQRDQGALGEVAARSRTCHTRRPCSTPIAREHVMTNWRRIINVMGLARCRGCACCLPTDVAANHVLVRAYRVNISYLIVSMEPRPDSVFVDVLETGDLACINRERPIGGGQWPLGF